MPEESINRLFYRFSLAEIDSLITSDIHINCFNKARFEVFFSDHEIPFSTVCYNLIEESTCSKPLSITERDNILQEFEYPLIPFQVPAWDSPLINSSPVRKRLEDCRGHSRSVSLEIRRESVVITDFKRHKMNIFYSRNNMHLISDGIYNSGVFSNFLHDQDALMIHSSCVSFDGRAAVFLAMDEGGKTTAATLCEGGRVLADDKIIFRRQDGQWLAYGTPWTTFPPEPRHAVPAAFFLLEKAYDFSLEKLGSRVLLSFLWDEHFKSRFLIPSMYQTALFDLYRDLSSSAPVYLMRFPKDYIDLDAILKCMKQ